MILWSFKYTVPYFAFFARIFHHLTCYGVADQFSVRYRHHTGCLFYQNYKHRRPFKKYASQQCKNSVDIVMWIVDYYTTTYLTRALMSYGLFAVVSISIPLIFLTDLCKLWTVAADMSAIVTHITPILIFIINLKNSQHIQ